MEETQSIMWNVKVKREETREREREREAHSLC